MLDASIGIASLAHRVVVLAVQSPLCLVLVMVLGHRSSHRSRHHPSSHVRL